MSVEKALRGVVLGGIFALPFIVFIVSTSLFFPFITGKNFAYRVIVECIAAAWLALALLDPQYRPKRSWILGAFALFTLIVAIADAQGVQAFKSFWSNYERMDGWVTLAHTFVYLVVVGAVVNTEKIWRALFHTTLAGSLVMALYSFAQLFGLISLTAGFSSLSRLDATFGNPIYLAVYMLFHVFLAALLLLQSYLPAGADRGPSKSMRLFYIACIVIDGVVIFLTGTRGTMLGLIGGILVTAVLFVLTAQDERLRRWAKYALATLGVLAALFFVIRMQPFAKDIPVLNRLATISLSDSTTVARFLNWGMAWKGVQERPLFGWGQENYAIVFDKYYDPRMYGQEQWFDRVHDIFFDWLVAAGVVGLLSYLSIFAVTLWALWRKTGGAAAFSAAEASLLTGLLAAYTVHNVFVFDNVSSYLLFATVLGYIVWRSAAARIPFPALPRKTAVFAAAGAVMLAGAAVWFVNAAAYRQNVTLLQALAPHEEGIMKNLDLFKQAIAYDSYGTQEAREQLAQITAQVAGMQQAPAEVKKQFVDAAIGEMQKQEQMSPLDARFPLFAAFVLDSYGDYAAAAAVLAQAHQLSPGKQTILFEQAQNALARGDNAGALAFYKQAYDLLPDVTESRFNYAALAIRQGKDALADELLAPIIPTGQAAEARIAAAYVARGRYDKIAAIWEAHVAAVPSDLQGYFTLAAAYYGAGERAKAIQVLQTVGEKFPEAKSQADGFIEQIQNGTAKI